VAGERSAHLAAGAAALLEKPASQLEDISAKDGWQPQEARDYLAEEAIHTTARLLASVVHVDEASPETLYQLNHVRLFKPGPGDSVKTNDGTRLFVSTRVLDYSGSVTLRMREKAALELSREVSANDFDVACQQAQLSYPVLCSIRVLVRPRSDGAAEHMPPSAEAGAQHASDISAVIVEAREQVWNPPTAAALALHPLLELLSESPERMVVARLAEIDKSPHAGLTVSQGRVSCECVLALVAATEKSKGNAFGAGFRVLTKSVVDCDIWHNGDGTGEPFQGQLASICSPETLTGFTLHPPRPGEVQHALVVISNVTENAATGQGKSLTVDGVEQVGEEAVPAVVKMLQKLAMLARNMPSAKSSEAGRANWSSCDLSPWKTGKRARVLEATPTDETILFTLSQ